MQDAREMGRGIEREQEEMTKDVGIEKGKEGDGQRGKKEEKNPLCYYLFNSILAANYGLRSLGLALTFPLSGSLILL